MDISGEGVFLQFWWFSFLHPNLLIIGIVRVQKMIDTILAWCDIMVRH